MGELFHHVRRELRVLLKEKMEPPLIDCRQSAGGLRHSVGITRIVIQQRDHADKPTWPCGLDHIITKPDVHFSLQQHVHLVTLIAFPEKEISGRELQRVSIVIKKVRRIHKCNAINDRNYKKDTVTAKLRLGDNPPCAAIKRFVVRVDEKLTAFVELESVIRRPAPFSDVGNLMIFVS